MIEEMQHYIVDIQFDDNNRKRETYLAASTWHAIDKARTEYLEQQPDRKKYKAYLKQEQK